MYVCGATRVADDNKFLKADEKRMSATQCNRFVENAWKKELCTNCFKPREEHSEVGDNGFAARGIVQTSTTTMTMTTTTTTTNSKIVFSRSSDDAAPQGILKRKTSSSDSRKRKSVAFPDALTSVIGYGGDDFSDSEEFELSESLGIEDDVPDGEEERTLSNLTRANTNFNTITANLSSNGSNDSKKSFASLMLGKPRKDSDGKKKTLLVSVTPFGGDNGIPSTRRAPSERKLIAGNFAGRQSKAVAANNDAKSEVTLKAVTNISEDKISRDRNEKETSTAARNQHHRERISEEPQPQPQPQISSREKIVDMPLITSSNLIAVIQKSDSLVPETTSLISTGVVDDVSHQQKSDRKIGITRTPGVKKQKDVDKPKISQGNYKQSLNTKNEYIARSSVVKENGSYHRIDEHEVENRELRTWLGTSRGKDVNTVTIQAAVVTTSAVESEGGNFGPKVSRELAGEPDGKADEEMVEPPALPRSPPPIESSKISKQQKQAPTSEPRNSFLHNVTVADKKTKPGIPHKPSSLRNVASPRGAAPILPNLGPRVVKELQEARVASMTTTAATLKKMEEKQEDHRTAEGVEEEEGEEEEEEEEEDEEEEEEDEEEEKEGEGKENGERRKERSESEEIKSTSGEADAELIRSPNKRRMAPKPPPSSATYAMVQEEMAVSLFARNPGAAILKSDSPVVREKEKRERASSCSPKFRKDVDETSELQPSVVATTTTTTMAPEPAPRRLISLSQDSLAAAGEKAEEKKKARSRFSLKKFLRMGSKKDQIDGVTGGGGSRIDDLQTAAGNLVGKPRLEIIHPLELDGAAVEVVSREKVARLSTDEQQQNFNNRESPAAENHDHSPRPPSSLSTSPIHHPFARPGKPPPPPRNQSLDDWARLDPANKPARPPPPRTEIKSPSKSWHPSSPTSPTSPDSIYANLAAEDVPGEVRSALAPSKPQRTASMRDQAVCQPPVKKRPAALPPRHEDYEIVNGARSSATDSPNMSNDSRLHGYECLSSSPECDSSLDLRHGAAGTRDATTFQPSGKRKSDSSALDPGNEFKYHHQPFTRSTSLPYCGSETESELYSPYSFYTGDEGPEEDQDWKNKEHELRIERLRQRRGRSIVHRSLEDNYGAVIVANHEALAQILEQLNQTSGFPPALRGLKTASLRLSDFALDPSTSVPIGRRVFYSGTWNDAAVTICVALDLALRVTRKEFNLIPIVEFTDTIPDFIAEEIGRGEKDEGVEATISVLPHLRVCTIGSFVGSLKDTGEESLVREASFVLLQLVNAFKNLQARGVEEAAKNLSNAVLCREDKDACHRLYLLQSLTSDADTDREQEKTVSLCQCVLHALRELRLSQRLPLVRELLERERTATLSQVKSVLEFSLWGPADVTLGAPRDREMTLQRWLDLERATVLHALIKARAPLAVTDEYHLLFLVRTSAKIMCEASILLDARRRK